MKRKSFKEIPCGIAQALEIIGDVWTVMIVRDAITGIDTFEEFHQSLGIARNTLSARLSYLCRLGLMVRTVDEEDKRRVFYTLNEAGRELWIVLLSLSQWGLKWATTEDDPMTYLADKETGQPLAEIIPHAADGRRVTLDDIMLVVDKPGPEQTRRKSVRYPT